MSLWFSPSCSSAMFSSGVEIESGSASSVLDGFAARDTISTPELNIALEHEGENHKLIADLQRTAHFDGATEINTIDGLRVEYPDGFGLMRASNTTPVIVLRFEADSQAALERIQRDFKRVLSTAKPGAAIPY